MQQDAPPANPEPDSPHPPLSTTVSPPHPVASQTPSPSPASPPSTEDALTAQLVPVAEPDRATAPGGGGEEEDSIRAGDQPSVAGEAATPPRVVATGLASPLETGHTAVGEAELEEGQGGVPEVTGQVSGGEVHAEVGDATGTAEERSLPVEGSSATPAPEATHELQPAADATPVAPAIVAPTPSSLSTPSVLLSSTPSSSTASTPILAAAQLPASAVPTYVAPAKKFASSLSVNKKFLEKAGAEKGKPEVKATVARLATPPIAPAVSTTHPRLLTGKISAVPVVSSTATPTVSGPSGWLKNAPLPEGQPKLTLPSQSDITSRGGSYERAKGMTGFGAGRGRGPAVWGSRNGGMGDLGMGGEFPTAAEAANVKALRAAAIAEQIQAKERAHQARAAAAAATNAHLLQGLDAFRGVHLDPNASHWDEMGDEDNDFLDDTIEFGDGTQYKIDVEAHAREPSPLGPRKVSNDAVDEPDPSDFATLEEPLAPGEAVHDPIRSERFKDDFDRTWKRPTPPTGESKNLFNERLGKFESYGSSQKSSTPASILGHQPDVAHGSSNERPSDHSERPHDSRPRRPSVTSPRLGKASLPPPVGRPWGREVLPSTEWSERGAGSGVDPRRRSIEHGARRPSFEQGTRRPSIEQTLHRPTMDQGIRQLPPHLVGTHPPARGLDRHEPPPHQRPALSPPVIPRTLPPHSTVLGPPKVDATPSLQPTHPTNPLPPSAVAATTEPPPIVDLEELHAREMHAAAERARKRRQEEEERVATESKERARKRLEELEARLAAEAKAKIIETPATPAPAPVVIPAKGERVDFWRDRSSARVAPPPRVPPPATKMEPTQILTRGEPPHLSRPASSLPTSSNPPLAIPVHPASLPSTNASPALPLATTTRPAPANIPVSTAEERLWRRNELARGSVDPASPSGDSSTSRQLPPHLVQAQPQAPSPVVVVLPSNDRSSPPAPAAVVEPPAPHPAPTQALPSPTTDLPPSLQPARKVVHPAPKAAQPFKLPEMSTLEDLMTRIKGAMAPPKTSSPDPSESISRSDSSSPSQIPTVKLPAARGKISTQTQLAAAARIASPGIPDPLEIVSKPAVIASESRSKARGRPEAKKLLPTPTTEKPDFPFDSSRAERSPSPPPAWKAFAVRLATYQKLRSVHPRQLKLFHNPRNCSKLNILSWEPPIYNLPRNLSRDELLLPPPRFLRNSIVVCLSNQPPPPPPTASSPVVPKSEAGNTASAPPTTPTTAPLNAVVRGGADQTLWRRAMHDSLSNQVRSSNNLRETPKPPPAPLEFVVPESVDTTTAPPTSALFDPHSPGRTTGPTSKLPSGSLNGFFHAGEATPGQEGPATPSDSSSRKFMVTSELDGVAIEVAPRESLDAPGADSLLETPKNAAFEPASSSLMTTPWTPPSPVSLAVLNPTALSVWSPPPADSPVHNRSVSLGGAKLENSLEGVADPEDFPVPITTSFADLKSDFEAANEAAEAPKRAAKDEARLRAAAPAFTFYPASSSTPPQPTYSREALTFQPSGAPLYSPNSFAGIPSQPHTLQYPQQPPPQPQPRLYPSAYPVQPQQLPIYGTSPLQSHQSYPPSPFAMPASTPSPHFASYRGAITNPALIAQAQGYGPAAYGAVGGAGGGAFGAVGGGLARGGGSAYLRSPSVTPQYPPPLGYVNGVTAMRVDGYGSPSPYPVSPVPLPQHLQSYQQQQQQQSYRNTMVPPPAGFRSPWMG